MSNRSRGNPYGRTKLVIDWEKADQLLEAGCLGNEVAAYFGMHPNTFYERIKDEYKITFSEYMQQKRSRGASCLRRKQYDVAMEGDRTMLIWLGKQRLQQREPEVYVKPPENQAAFNQWAKAQKES